MNFSDLFVESDKKATLITIFTKETYNKWLKSQNDNVKNWIKATGYKAKGGEICFIPNDKGKIDQAIVSKGDGNDAFSLSGLYSSLKAGVYKITNDLTEEEANSICIDFALDAYSFNKYKESKKETFPKLIYPKQTNKEFVSSIISSIYLVRDLINTPSNDMGPSELADACKEVALKIGASINITDGEELKQNYPAVFEVGKGSERAPKFIEISWGDEKNPLIALVGKGVCFDTGGLDIKGASGMKLMKKDMGGAATALGLLNVIALNNLKVRIKLYIPAVENSISGISYRPSDIINTRKKITIEVTNTDAEGRIILADALTKASEEKPSLIIDFATLTGAARVALGPEIPVFFTNNDKISKQIDASAEKTNDYMWRLPLHKPYKKYMESKIADMVNSSSSGMAGAITAALFLESFVDKNIPWVHIDTFAYNESKKAGKPEGGEALALKAVFDFISNNHK